MADSSRSHLWENLLVTHPIEWWMTHRI